MENNNLLVFDTSQQNFTKEIPLFKLVDTNDPILYSALKKFDFDNPPVNPIEFASSLVETCKKNNGLGLSANQCGFDYRVFVMGNDNEYVAMFNPFIVQYSKDTNHLPEGCLSVPGFYVYITRPIGIEVEYQDYNGNKKSTYFEGLSSRIFQHEYDHMGGIMFTTRANKVALSQAKKRYSKKFKKVLDLR